MLPNIQRVLAFVVSELLIPLCQKTTCSPTFILLVSTLLMKAFKPDVQRCVIV